MRRVRRSKSPSPPRDREREERWAIKCNNGTFWSRSDPFFDDEGEVKKQGDWLNQAKAWAQLAPFTVVRLVELRDTECIADARSYEGQLEDQRRTIAALRARLQSAVPNDGDQETVEGVVIGERVDFQDDSYMDTVIQLTAASHWPIGTKVTVSRRQADE